MPLGELPHAARGGGAGGDELLEDHEAGGGQDVDGDAAAEGAEEGG